MTYPNAKAYAANRLDKIARQIQRIESHEREWEAEAERFATRSSPTGTEPPEREGSIRETRDRFPGVERKRAFRWESGPNLDRLKRWGDHFERLRHEMVQQTKKPFSVRTQQISVLCAFIPFVLAVMIASVRFMPNLPDMPLWSKFTWFLGIPIILSVAGALVGLMVGVILDTVERQAEILAAQRGVDFESEPRDRAPASAGAKSGVWVAVGDLEPNQRVAETVVGPDDTPILLRHTLIKPSHIEMLREQNIEKVRIEAVTYPAGGELAVAG